MITIFIGPKNTKHDDWHRTNIWLDWRTIKYFVHGHTACNNTIRNWKPKCKTIRLKTWTKHATQSRDEANLASAHRHHTDFHFFNVGAPYTNISPWQTCNNVWREIGIQWDGFAKWLRYICLIARCVLLERYKTTTILHSTNTTSKKLLHSNFKGKRLQ